MLTRIDHVGIACRDLEEKIAFYCSTFGLTVVSREINEEQGVQEAMLAVAAEPGAGDYPPGPGDLRSATGPATGDPRVAPAAASYIQLLEPTRPDSPVGKFLARRGEGLHHVGYGVADIRATLAAIGATGVRLIDERPRHGSMGASIAFLHPADVGGVLTELVQPAGPPGLTGDPGWR
jgi:methylmalonyl-CoA/ethylmalonyl-CoA epimerase